MPTRSSPIHLVRRALRQPSRIVPYIRRRLRNRALHKRTTSHPQFYREVMASDISRRGARGAVGTPTEKRWMELGAFQFEYLTEHGLERSHRLLEIGCGNLRAGWRFIEWLDVAGYTGVDISPGILIEATNTVQRFGLQEKVPSLILYDGLDLGFLPADQYDVVHAHSVFSHVPITVLESILQHVSRVLAPGGFFDFTYNSSETGEVWGFLDEDFYYPTQTLIDLAAKHGLEAAPAAEWEYKQEKIRAEKPQISAHADEPAL